MEYNKGGGGFFFRACTFSFTVFFTFYPSSIKKGEEEEEEKEKEKETIRERQKDARTLPRTVEKKREAKDKNDVDHGE